MPNTVIPCSFESMEQQPNSKQHVNYQKKEKLQYLKYIDAFMLRKKFETILIIRF